MKTVKFILIPVVMLFFITCSIQENENGNTSPVRDWTSPERIDPFSKNIGKLLETDLRDYMIAADQAYWDKDYLTAAKNYLFLISHNIHDIISTYNLACMYALLNEPELSAKFLFRAVDMGFVDFNYIQTDSDFDPVREDKYFKNAIDSISQLIRNLGEEIIVESRSLMKCRVTKPLAFYPDEKYPMVIALHEEASNQNHMAKIWRFFDIPDFILAVPQAPFSVPFGQVNTFRWSIDEISPEKMNLSDKISKDYVLDVINTMKKQYKIGDVYLLGLHQGASVAFDVALKHPDQIRGVIAFGADYKINDISDVMLMRAKEMVRFFVVNSPNDAYIDQERSSLIDNTLKSKGFNHVFLEIEEEYSISRDALKQSERWLQGR